MGFLTLRRLFALCERFPSDDAFYLLGTVIGQKHLSFGPQALMYCGVVAWLEKHLERFVSFSPDRRVTFALLCLCKRLLTASDKRNAMRPLYHYFATALSLFPKLGWIGIAEQAALCFYYCLSRATEERSTMIVALVHSQPGALATLAHLCSSLIGLKLAWNCCHQCFSP